MVQPVMKHRGVNFDVDENPPSFWHWKIYSEAGRMAIGNMKFQTRKAAVDACIIEINGLLDKDQSGSDKQQASDLLRILHGARGLPLAEAAEALGPFLESMRKNSSDGPLAHASIAAVTELARSLRENHAASDDLWQEAIETTLSFANEAG
jgi:hypothetical protein